MPASDYIMLTESHLFQLFTPTYIIQLGQSGRCVKALAHNAFEGSSPMGGSNKNGRWETEGAPMIQPGPKWKTSERNLN